METIVETKAGSILPPIHGLRGARVCKDGTSGSLAYSHRCSELWSAIREANRTYNAASVALLAESPSGREVSILLRNCCNRS
jgi:hypothetical protein